MRDHRKLRAFEVADGLAVSTYRATARFPRQEQFGLTQQMRRAAVSCVSNIVEGCARKSISDYLRFLDMAYGSVCELEYQCSLASRLEYMNRDEAAVLAEACGETARVLNGLIRSLRRVPRP